MKSFKVIGEEGTLNVPAGLDYRLMNPTTMVTMRRETEFNNTGLRNSMLIILSG